MIVTTGKFKKFKTILKDFFNKVAEKLKALFKKDKKKKSWLRWVIRLMIILIVSPLAINLGILASTAGRMNRNIDRIEPADGVLILGAAVYSKDRVSQVVYDRIVRGAELYNKGKARKILVSGDHGQKEYDEVNTIRKWLMKFGIPKEDIFLDHAGFSTYESLYRARHIFQVKSLIIVTQEFHLPRALYIASGFGIQAQGYIADRVQYKARKYNTIREFLARIKDFFYITFLKPKPEFLGSAIPLSGDGTVTHDK